MVDKKEETRKRGRSSSSSSSSSSGSSSSGSSSSGSRSSSSSSSSASRSRSPRRRDTRVAGRGRSRSRSARRSPIRARADRGADRDRPSRRSPSPRHRRRSPSPTFRRRDRSGSRGRRARSPRRSPVARSPRRGSPIRKRSLSPAKKVCVRNLSKNVLKAHVEEIFSIYGPIKIIDLPTERSHPHLHRGSGYIEYENIDDAEKAIKFMDGGQLDGQVVAVEMTLSRSIAARRSSPLARRRSPVHRKSSPPFRRDRGDRAGFSPRRRSPARGSGANTMPLGPSRFNRSRSPVDRNRRSRS